ncbi:unnamed protein product [Rotaria sp. Silwood1]|nr:unnamed protein product [Rotaria sp. Silwood1]
MYLFFFDFLDNACAFVYCKNGGKCIEDPTTIDCFKCQCTPGYTGRICETQIPILPIGCNPGCQNGGTCIGNSCKCNPGYTGTYCEIRDFCSPNNPCQNGGQCISSSLNFICNCVGTGYTGIICTDIIPIDVCQTNPCQNGGTCYKGGNSFVCACLPGWTGNLCTDYENVVIPTTTTPNVPLCTPNPCLNSGTCYSNNFGFVCACPPGWTGTFCTDYENVVIPTTTTPIGITCANQPCKNGATCYNTGNSYYCYCGPTNTYTGINCEIVSPTVVPNCPLNCAPGYCVSSGSTVHPYVFDALQYPSVRQTGANQCPNPNNNACAFVDCENSGKCIEDPTTIDCFKCQCTPGYTGRICETQIPILPIKCNLVCENGGTCIGNGAGYLCKCAAGWSGTYCQIKETNSPCDSNPCGIYGTCFEINLSGGSIAYCNCEDRWTGRYCNVNIEVKCPSGYCFSGGTCGMNGNIPYCVCPAMYTGERCELLVGTLTTTTTTMPGVVTDTTTMTIIPTTTTLLTTTTISIVSSVCSSNPCKHGGTCVPIGISYSCFCGTASIYTGKNCDSTTPMTTDECPLNCAPGHCIFSGNAQKPYACLWNGVMRPTDGTTG